MTDKSKLHYNPYILPPRLNFNISLSISRKRVPNFCEQMHFIISERRGSSFYYPNISEKKITCRYEWHRQKDQDRFGIRIGVLMEIDEKDIENVAGYITTRQAVEKSQDDSLSAFDDKLVNEIIIEVQETFKLAFERIDSSKWQTKLNVFHIETPFMLGFSERLSLNDGNIIIFPTKIVDDKLKRVSAVIVKTEASSDEASRADALKKFGVFCALLTLANNQFYKHTTLDWEKGDVPVKFLNPKIEINEIEENSLYPKNIPNSNTEQMDQFIVNRIKWVMDKFNELPYDKREEFKTALFAFSSGKDVFSSQSTLAIVAYVAALSSLIQNERKACSGTLSCSEHGNLSINHQLISDRTAIEKLIVELFNIENDIEKRKELNELIRRVYYKQRSAFVHGAVLRHKEFGQGNELPSAFPTTDQPVSDLYYFSSDLISIDSIVRRTLLEWLAKYSGSILDLDIFNIDSKKIVHSISIEGIFTFPEETMISLKMKK